MNAYFVAAGFRPVLQEYIGGWPRYEEERDFVLVFAETRGQAKSLFAREHDDDFTAVQSCRLVQRDVERERGEAKEEDALWDRVWAVLFPESAEGSVAA